MSREEDLIRSTTRAIALTVREVPPLRLEQAADELRSPAREPRRDHGNRPRRWRSWAAPLTAAAVVVVLAIALVIVKDIPNGSAVPANRSTAAPGAASVPRYFVALKQLAGDMNSPDQRNDIVVGDSLTGKTLATLAPPARTAFESVSAAADDRTFVIFAVTSSTGSFEVNSKDATLTANFYEVRLAPGSVHPATLTRLPIKPQTAPASFARLDVGAFSSYFGAAVSLSGQELAVPEGTTPHGLMVKVFSVATGRLLHQWTSTDVNVVQQPSLAWIDGDRELAVVTRNMVIPIVDKQFAATDSIMRELPLAGPVNGDLVADGKVVFNVKTVKNPLTAVQQCVEPAVGGPVLISADGKTFSCTTAGGSPGVDHLSFHTYPLAASTTATAPGTIDYQVTFQKKGTYIAIIPEVLWTSPTGGTVIGAMIPYQGSPFAVARGLRIGVMSQGKFTPLRVPASIATSTLVDIVF
jgi:hypothetical protein